MRDRAVLNSAVRSPRSGLFMVGDRVGGQPDSPLGEVATRELLQLPRTWSDDASWLRDRRGRHRRLVALIILPSRFATWGPPLRMARAQPFQCRPHAGAAQPYQVGRNHDLGLCLGELHGVGESDVLGAWSAARIPTLPPADQGADGFWRYTGRDGGCPAALPHPQQHEEVLFRLR